MAMQRAKDKTEKMKAKSETLDDIINSGILTDNSSKKDEIEIKLEKITVQSSVDEELAKLKSERQRKRKYQVEQEA